MNKKLDNSIEHAISFIINNTYIDIPSLEKGFNGIIDTGDAEAIEIMNKMKEAYVMANHKNSITLTTKGRYKTYIGTGKNRKAIERKEKDELIDYLYHYYSENSLSHYTFRQVFEYIQHELEYEKNRSKNTITRNWQDYNRFISEEFGNRKVKDISKSDILAYIQNTVKQMKPKPRALDSFVSLINRVMKTAYQLKITQDNICDYISSQPYYKDCDLTTKEAEDIIFSDEQIKIIKEKEREHLKQHPKNIRPYAVLLSIETGMRIGEIPALKWEDISDDFIHIHRQQLVIKENGKPQRFKIVPYTKNERSKPKGGRYFPLTTEIKNILIEIMDFQKKNGIVSEYVFAENENEPIKKTGLQQHLMNTCSHLGFNITNNHAFRMTLNSNVLIPMGLNTKQRAELLGHSIRVNEEHYSHILKTDIAKVGKLLDDFKKVQNSDSDNDDMLNTISLSDYQQKKAVAQGRSNIWVQKNKQSLVN